MWRVWVRGARASLSLHGGGVLTAVLIANCGGSPKATSPPPPVVSVATVQQKDVPGYHEYAGVLQAYVSADMRARVEGFLLEQRYTEGAFVKRGQLLFVIDPKPFEAAKLQAEGNLLQGGAREGQGRRRPRPTARRQASGESTRP